MFNLIIKIEPVSYDMRVKIETLEQLNGQLEAVGGRAMANKVLEEDEGGL